MSNIMRNIPSVNELLESQPLKRLSSTVSHNVVVSGIRNFLDDLRTQAREKTADVQLPLPSELAERIANWILTSEQPTLRPVINATGILLHTGLGRAPLAMEALTEIHALASGYCSLEVDLESGRRSQRTVAVETLLHELTGAEACLVVNNNAGATLLTLAAIAAEQEVVVSRGELVEIGGSYRLPEVMTASKTKLVEVGTTNRTRASDYVKAMSEKTAAFMKVHPSNYAIVGFTQNVSIAELAVLGKKHGCLVIDDIGSGALLDYQRYGLSGEPVASESIAAGADLVLFSGDKLLGGPQCGIIAGRKSLVEKIKEHPLSRAFRVDKLTLGALTATLRLYRDPEMAEQSIPLLSLLSTSLENLDNRSQRLAPQIAAIPLIAEANPVASTTFLGGGSLPNQQIDTWCVALKPARGNVEELATGLRRGTPAVFGRVQQDQLFLDLRTVFPAQDSQITEAVRLLDQTPESTYNSMNDAQTESNK